MLHCLEPAGGRHVLSRHSSCRNDTDLERLPGGASLALWTASQPSSPCKCSELTLRSCFHSQGGCGARRSQPNTRLVSGFQTPPSTVSETGRVDTICSPPPPSHHSVLLFHSQGITEEPLVLGLENPRMKISGGGGVCVGGCS